MALSSSYHMQQQVQQAIELIHLEVLHLPTSRVAITVMAPI